MPLVALAIAAAPAQASASSQDVASTHAVITVGYTLARSAVASIPVAQSKIEAYNSRLQKECGGVGAGSPDTEASQQMSSEVAAALWSITYGSYSAQIAKFATTIRPLHWTNKRFERAVRGFSATLTGLSKLPLPDLCGDVRTWKSSGFTTIPNDVAALDRHVESLTLPDIPWGLVRSYERGGDAGLVTSIRRLELKAEEAEFKLGQDDWYQILGTLKLEP